MPANYGPPITSSAPMKKLIINLRNLITRLPHASGTTVILFGLPKSGTSILFENICHALTPKRQFFEPRQKDGQNDTAFHRRITSHHGGVVTKTLFYPNHPHDLPELIALYDRAVCIVRDPRDQLISSFFYRWYHNHNPDEKSFHRALALVKQKEASPSSIPFRRLSGPANNLAESYDALAQVLDHAPANVLIVRYEDIMDGAFEQLSAHLGATVTAEFSGSDSPRMQRVARTRAYGNWRFWFTPDDVDHFRELLNPVLMRFGYNTEDWKLESPISLSPEFGSTYMERLFRPQS